MDHKNLLANSININNATLAFFSRFRQDKPKFQTETIQIYWWGFFTCKSIKSAQNQSWTVHSYVLWTYKIYCFTY